MAVPKYQETMLPALVAAGFNLTDQDKGELISRGFPRYASNIGWAVTYLKQAGLLESKKRGEYSLSERGRVVLKNKPTAIDNAFLSQFEEFESFRRRKSERDVDVTNSQFHEAELGAGLTPIESLDAAYRGLRSAVEVELLSQVKAGSPSFFEQVVVDVLVAMGYGGNRSDAARAIGKSGDGGIDGIIAEDRLGLDIIYVQAKRWEGVVGRPEIQKFNGALAGHRARKGVFVTTSSFTKESQEYVDRIETRIVLIDGARLAALMYEHGVGVSVRQIYEVKSLDTDYFDASA